MKDSIKNDNYISDNYQSVLKRINEACTRVNRDTSEVTLIAVSKTKPLEMIVEAVSLGMTRFGENKPQDIRDKNNMLMNESPEIGNKIQWHMIGSLQKNKIKYVIDTCVLIHSVDSLELLFALEKEAAKRDITVNVLLQLNISEETSKSGFTVTEFYSILPKFKELKHVSIEGLMTIPPFVDNPEDNRVYFKQLREIFIDIKSKNIDNVNMHALSMGMTDDFEVAIEEGATFIRVGTGIFGERNYIKREVL